MPNALKQSVIEASIATARRWSEEARSYPEPRAAVLLGDALKEPGGLRFTLDFVDGVLRPEDKGVAARNLAELSQRPVKFLPFPLDVGLKAVSPVARPALDAVRRAFAMVVGDLVVDFGSALGPTLARLRRDGAGLNINLLGEAVLGERHARSRLRRTMELVERDDVDYVSIKVSSVLGPHAPFAHDATVAEAVERLRPLFRLAQANDTFVNLDMEEYRDLHVTLDVYRALLTDPELREVRTGVAVQTYLKESLLLLAELDTLAAERVASGGSPIKLRLVKGANLAMEKVLAELRGWENPVFASKEETDASFLRALDFCLHPDRSDHLLTGAASHNVFALATAWELAQDRGVTHALDIEMLSGMAVPLQRVIMREVGGLRLYVPVVPRAEYDAAIAYLVRRLEENAAPENFMSGAVGLGHDMDFLEREEKRFLNSVAHFADPVPDRWAEQERTSPADGFANAQDTNPALLGNQRWAAHIQTRLPEPSLGQAAVDDATVTTEDGIEHVIAAGVAAGPGWAATPATERAAALRRLGDIIEDMRADLITAAGDEVGKLIDQADVEVSEAVDFAYYYADLALDAVPGVEHVPPRLTLVAPPWNFPIAIPLGGVAAALAAGSAVVLKPAPPSRRIAALLAEACGRAGFPDDVMQLIVVEDGPLGQQLVTDERVELVVLTGAAETAEMFRSWRPSLPLLAETSGKNALVITPSADLDLAAADLTASAFGHAGQKCSAASLAILVGSVADSKRFRNQLRDAVSSLRVAWPTAPAGQMGPLTEAPSEKLMRGLTQLEPGQSWLLEPRQLDTRLWRPGIRLGVRPGSEYHQVEYFGPVLGIMAARDLDEAISWQNGTEFGLTAGLHSLDAEEINHWLSRIEAGNVYVNRSITGAIVRRQPFGGWKRSAVGHGTKAGGPNYLTAFGTRHPSGAVPLPTEADAAEFVTGHDPSGLTCELNELRYLPAPVTVRVEDAPEAHVRHEAMAALLVGATPRFSFRTAPGPRFARALREAGCTVEVATDDVFDVAVRGRVRHLGGRDLLAAVMGSIDVSIYAGDPLPGRLAFLPYVREQAVSVTMHRFGHPSAIAHQLRTGR